MRTSLDAGHTMIHGKEGKTQAEIAAILNISQSYVSLLERKHNYKEKCQTK